MGYERKVFSSLDGTKKANDVIDREQCVSIDRGC
jgi:hypothetical protein